MSVPTQLNHLQFVQGVAGHLANEVWEVGKEVVRLQAGAAEATSFVNVNPLGVQQGTGEVGIGARIDLTEAGIRLSVGETVSLELIRDAGITLQYGVFVLTLGPEGLIVEVGDSVLSLSEEGLNVVAGDAVLDLSAAGLVVEGPSVELTADATATVDAADLNLVAGDLSIDAGMTETL